MDKKKLPVFPTLSRLPSSIRESQFWPFEAEDYPEDRAKAFLAQKSIEPGAEFAEEIRHALLNSKEIWLIVSPSSVGSEWVISEWGAGWALKKKIVPILHRCAPETLPDRLKRLKCIDLHLCEDLINKTFPQEDNKEKG